MRAANRAVFINRDGTMARDVPYCRRPEDFELFSDTSKAIRLLNQNGFKVNPGTGELERTELLLL